MHVNVRIPNLPRTGKATAGRTAQPSTRSPAPVPVHFLSHAPPRLPPRRAARIRRRRRSFPGSVGLLRIPHPASPRLVLLRLPRPGKTKRRPPRRLARRSPQGRRQRPRHRSGQAGREPSHQGNLRPAPRTAHAEECGPASRPRHREPALVDPRRRPGPTQPAFHQYRQ